MALTDKYHPRKKLISDEADAAAWCPERLMKISEARVLFIRYADGKGPFR